MTDVAPVVSTIVEMSVDIDASRDVVYRLWTTADGLTSWWGRTAEVDLREGGRIVVDLDGEHIMVGEFTTLDPPQRIEMTFGWRDGDPPPGSTAVEVSLQELPTGGTRVRVRHSGLPAEHVGNHVTGWTHFLGEPLIRAGETA